MERLILPLMMYKEKGSVKKGTKKSQLVVPTWNHLYIRRGSSLILDEWVYKHIDKMNIELDKWILENKWIKTENKKVIVNTYVYWNDSRKKDAHNIMKLHMDIFNDKIYDDDSNALLRIMDIDIDFDNPRIEFEFEIGEEFDRKKIKDEHDKKKKLEKKLEKELEKELLKKMASRT